MEDMSNFAAEWFSAVQSTIRNPETKFYSQNIFEAVHGLLSRVQVTISNCSNGNCSETEDAITTEVPGNPNGTASCLTSNQRMVLNSLLNDLNNYSSCIDSKKTECRIDDYFQDIIIMKDLFSDWNSKYIDLHYVWDTYINIFAPGLLNIWKSWWDDDNREQYALLSDSIEVVDFLKNALPPTDTEFRKLDAVSD